MDTARMIVRRTLASRHKAAFRRPTVGTRIASVGTATPPTRYTQEQVLELFGEKNPKIRRLYCNSHIKTRFLYLPEPVDGTMPDETNEQLIQKHLAGCLEIGPQAIEQALQPLGLAPYDVDFLCCVSSTGLLVPGISAHLIKRMGFRENVWRADLLGMGCNAAMNGLQVVTGLATSQPGKTGLLLCVEVCSAAYVYTNKLSTAVVNSLFGDGAGAAVIRVQEDDTWEMGPMLVDFEPHIVTEALDAMKYELEGTKLSFYLDRDIPYVIGREVEKPVHRLLGRHGLRVRDIDHWVIHSGGKKVIDAIEYNLGLSDYDVRHTLNILKNYGNLSSGSVLFSYKELRREGVVDEGDLGVLIAMGPGTSIETALISW
jgi:polyketide synthase Type III